jgi:Flp pilus assembly protein TadG
MSAFKPPATARRWPSPFGGRRRSRGQAMVEFALILPVLMLLFATTLDLGRLALAELSIDNAAREGAFQAAKTPTDFDNTKACPASATSNTIVCRVQLEAKSSGVTINPADISVSCSVSGCPKGLGNHVTVAVVGHFQLLTPILAPFFGGSTAVTFTRSATNQIETLPVPPTGAPTAVTPSASASTLPSASASESAGASGGPSASPVPTPTPSPTPNCTLPSAGFTFTLSPDLPNNYAPVTFTMVNTTTSPFCPILAWFWDFGDNTTSTEMSPPAHVYVAKGNYKVTLTVTNAVGTDTTGAVQVHAK